jgi:predicted ATPase
VKGIPEMKKHRPKLAPTVPGIFIQASPARQLALLAAMHRLVQRNSQFIIATHSPILLGFPGATIYVFAEKRLSQIAYLDTEHYQITKAFLDRPERMLNELFRADEPSDT